MLKEINKVSLVDVYKGMSKAQIDEEIESIFHCIYAMLESQDCTSIESFPTTNLRLEFKLEEIKDSDSKFLC